MCIPNCDVKYPIELEELFQEHIVHALPTYENLLYWHQLLMQYAQEDSAIFLIRKNTIDGKDVRGEIITSRSSGIRMLFADNAPAWAVMQHCFEGWRPTLEKWKHSVLHREIPWHFFGVSHQMGHNHYNARGWHIAHIEDINDRSDPHYWDMAEIRKRCLRFVHPINMFPFPLQSWQKYAGLQYVKSFIRKQYDLIYPRVRNEFLDFLGIRGCDEAGVSDADYMIDFNMIIQRQPKTQIQGGIPVVQTALQLKDLHFSKVPTEFQLDDGRNGVCWEYSRLIFWREPIENLQGADDLIVIRIAPTQKSSKYYTPGIFVLSQGEFRIHFGNILKSKSFQEGGCYHFSCPPLKALAYFVPFQNQ